MKVQSIRLVYLIEMAAPDDEREQGDRFVGEPWLIGTEDCQI